jgi:hypothetical protein
MIPLWSWYVFATLAAGGFIAGGVQDARKNKVNDFIWIPVFIGAVGLAVYNGLQTAAIWEADLLVTVFISALFGYILNKRGWFSEADVIALPLLWLACGWFFPVALIVFGAISVGFWIIDLVDQPLVTFMAAGLTVALVVWGIFI